MPDRKNAVVSQFELYGFWLTLRGCHDEGMEKSPRDPNQLAKMIVDIAIGEVEDTISDSKRNPDTVKGRAGWHR